MITYIFIISILLPMILLMIAYSMNYRFLLNRMKLSPFECGFEPVNQSRIPFSMRFYMLIIIFVVFDIEVVLLLPLPIMLSLNSLALNFMSLLFLSLLLMGLLHEINEGTINWSK
nr:TPA: NADH dehydrogenase subunit 3 [Holtodrilus truncatus]